VGGAEEAVTADKIAQWKSERQVRKLNDRADDAESYAVAVMQVAVAAVDEAETAAIEAVLARIDAVKLSHATSKPAEAGLEMDSTPMTLDGFIWTDYLHRIECVLAPLQWPPFASIDRGNSKPASPKTA